MNIIETIQKVETKQSFSREELRYTIKKFKKVLEEIGITDCSVLSAENSIELVIKLPYKYEDFYKKIDELEIKRDKISSMFCNLIYPVYDDKGLTKKKININVMLGTKYWLNFGYKKNESKYTDFHKNVLISGIFKYALEDITSDEEAIKIINKTTKSKWIVEDFNTSFKQLWDKTKNTFNEETVEKIKLYVSAIIETNKHELSITEHSYLNQIIFKE